MRRSLKFGALLVAVFALCAPAAAQAGSFTIAPAGAIVMEKSQLVITHYQLTVSRYPLWIRAGTRTCDVELSGVAHAGPIADGGRPDYAVLMELSSGSTSNCTDPADVTFADGAWRLSTYDGGYSPLRGVLRNAQIQMPVGGTTCDYEFRDAAPTSYGFALGNLTATPVLVGSSLVNTWDPSFWAGVVSTAHLHAVPRSATCGAIRIDNGGGTPWEISPGQTITELP